MLFPRSQTRSFASPALWAAALAVLAGCGGSTSPLSTAPLPSGASASRLQPDGLGGGVQQKIFVVSEDGNDLTTYTDKGVQTNPTITGLNAPVGLAVDANGKIYVANSGASGSQDGSITTYTASGEPTSPTITTNIQTPWGIAVDNNGKIYVANYNGNTVTTYLADGTPTTPTITGLQHPTAVAVDASGKIYVTQDGSSSESSSLTTYNANGNPAKPTITAGIYQPQSVALDASGNIYVSNDGATNITTYKPNGKQRKVTMSGFTTGSPGFIAIGATGKVYVSSSFGYVTAYTKSGKPTNPTISGIGAAALGIAVH